VVISAPKQRETVDHILSRIQRVINHPLEVLGLDARYHPFTPRFGVGVLAVDILTADPAAMLDQAEKLAQNAQPPVDPSLAVTTPASL
jgi:hypothetical protein